MNAFTSLLSVVVVAASLAACDDLYTASGDFGVNFNNGPDFSNLWAPPYMAVAGTLLCAPSGSCGRPCAEDAPICEDVSLAVSGTELDSAGCYPVAAGEVIDFELTPMGCTQARAPESLTVRGVGITAVEARLVPGLWLATDMGANSQVAPLLLSSQGAPLASSAELASQAALVDQSLDLTLRLFESASGRMVGWNPGSGVLSVTPEGQVTLDGATTVNGSLPAGATIEASLALEGESFAVGEVAAVSAAELDRIEVTAILLDGGAQGQQPLMVQAQVRTQDGRLVAGVPLSWAVIEGDLVLPPRTEEQADSPVIGATADIQECLPRRPEQTRRGVVEASYGELRGRVEFLWQGYEGENGYEAEACVREGCHCSSSGGTGGAGWMGFLTLLLLLGRRGAVTWPRAAR